MSLLSIDQEASLPTRSTKIKAARVPAIPLDADDINALIARLRKELQSVIVGKAPIIELLITAVLAEGSVLIEDVPGVGKTTLAKSLAAAIELRFARVQCTPDLLPADIVGFSVFQPQQGTFEFKPGPLFTNLLLVDEINRASPRTQSALLEAMAERQVSVDGKKVPLPDPFMVIATQNPVRFIGTFPLPESQLDRVMFLLSMDYPDAESEVSILLSQAACHPIDDIQAVLSQAEVRELQWRVRQLHVQRNVVEFIVAIAAATRSDPRLKMGVSPRGSQSLLRAAQASAIVQGRDYVLPDDVISLAPMVLAHRIVANHAATLDVVANRQRIVEIVQQIEVPV